MSEPLRGVVEGLRAIVSRQHFRDVRDADLLREFFATRSSDAFACLMRRHGPMVMGLARRIVRDQQVAEDVFQATFLILARKAKSIRGRDALPAWLHSVALRLATRAKKSRQRIEEKHTHVAKTSPTPPSDPLDEISAREYLTMLDEEIARLPEKYRLPLILCHLEGLSLEEAAKRLGTTSSSIKGMLERGRTLLRQRLIKRGLPAGSLALSPLALGTTAKAAVGPSLIHSTLQAALTSQGASASAVALAEGAIMMMTIAKIKIVCCAAVLCGAVAVGAGWMAVGAGTGEEATPRAEPVAMKLQAEQTKQEPQKLLDLYGDPLPEGAVKRLGTVQQRAAGASLAMSPDGKTLIGVRGGKYVSYWDVDSGKLKDSKELTGPSVLNGVLSPDGRWLTNSSASVLKIFDVRKGSLAHEFSTKGAGAVAAWLPAFSPDGNLVATGWGSGGLSCHIRVWDLRTGKETLVQEAAFDFGKAPFPLGVSMICFSPDNSKLLASFTASDAGTVCWNLDSGKQIWQAKAFVPGRNELVFTPNNTLTWRKTTLNLMTGQPVKLASLPPIDSLSRIATSPDLCTLYVSGAKGIQVWDMEVGKEIRVLEGAGEEMIIVPDGKTIITNNGALQRWDIATGKALYPETFNLGHIQESGALVFSADGTRLASAAADGSVRQWDIATGKVLHVWSGHEATRPVGSMRWVDAGVQALDMTPDGRWIVSAGSELKVKVWDGVSGKEVSSMPFPQLPPHEHDPVVSQLRLSPDGQKATGYLMATGVTRIAGEPFTPLTQLFVSWDVKNGAIVSKVSVEHFAGRGSLISKDGRLLVSGSRVVSLVSGKESARLEIGGSTAKSPMDLSRDGSIIASASELRKEEKKNYVYSDGYRIWETASGKTISHLQNKFNGGKLLLHPNCQYLVASGSEGIHIWDVRTEKIVANLVLPELVRLRKEPNTFTSALAFTPDGKHLATAQRDGTILIWKLDLPTPKSMRLNVNELDSLWSELKDNDAAKAWQAVWRMVDAPEDSVSFLVKKLKPFQPAGAAMTAPLLADLGSDAFAKREAANKQLKELGLSAETALKEHLKTNPPLEVKQRLELLLKSIVDSPPSLTQDDLRNLRGVAVLSRMHSPQANGILEALAKGVESAPLTVAAKAALGK